MAANLARHTGLDPVSSKLLKELDSGTSPE
ncbi:MAG: hypothetical protein BMS9Abin26_1223 [Gammaproteobacteria bacterium]|nr:MAG: hypothetical protein BMS9Abin26_1223 [Gammaproteobacteria bacterium]